MAIQEDGNIYIKLCSNGEKNSTDESWDDGIAGRIKQILLWHTDYVISGFMTNYERRGECLISKNNGGTEGDFETINFKKPLTWLSGHYGSYCEDPDLFFVVNEEDHPHCFKKRIFSLKFGNEEETYGPFGCEEGTPFFFRGSNEIVGFHGFCSQSTADRRDGYISAIGVYIKTEASGILGQPSNPNESILMIKEENKPLLISGK